MARKRKSLPKASQPHGERKRKRRATAYVNRDTTYLPTPSTSPSPTSTMSQISDSSPSQSLRSSTSPSPDSIFAAIVRRTYALPRKWSGENLSVDLANQMSFLETVANEKKFIGFNNIAEITSTLRMAREGLDRDGSAQGVSLELFKRVAALFAARKTKYVRNLSRILVDLAEKAMLPTPLSYDNTINWYNDVDIVLYNTHDYAYDYELQAKWDKAATHTLKKFNEGMRTLQQQGDVDEHWNLTTVQSSAPEQSTASLPEPSCPMDLLQGPASAIKCKDILEQLRACYERQNVKTTMTEGSEIFRDLHIIKLCVSKLFSASRELKMILQEILGKDEIHAYHDWCLRFEAIWATPAISAIQQRFLDLKKITDCQPLGRAELTLFEFAKDLESLVMECNCPENASLDEWSYMVPGFVSEMSAAKAASDLEGKYLAFQDHAYLGAELTNLWLLVWRTLKAIQFPLPEEPEEVLFPGKESKMSQIDPFAIERAFFESDGQPSSNQVSLSRFVQTGDIKNPPWIEEFVGKYCDHVAKCHNEKGKYYWQFSTFGPKPVPTVVVTTLQASSQRPNPHPDWNMLLHRVVLRLNHLLGDQKVLKRWSRDKKTQSLAYLDVGKSSIVVRERGRGQASGGSVNPNGKKNSQENVGDASNGPTGRSALGALTGGGDGDGGQDGEGSGDGNCSDRDNQGRKSKSSTSSGSSSSYSDQENQPPPAGTEPLPTGPDFDAYARNSASPTSSQIPPLRPADYDAADAEVQRVLNSLADNTASVNPASSPVRTDPNHENVISPPVDAGSLATRTLPSAFAWVQYPLGETRASERAQSLQISREMHQRGIATSGPHMEDVQNIVPEPLRLVPAPEDDVFQPGPRTHGLTRRALAMIGGLMRPLPFVRQELLPLLPARRRRSTTPTPSPLTANRDGISRVQRARDRKQRGSSSPSSSASFTPRHSWIRNLADSFPWDDPNQASSLATRSTKLGSLSSILVGERRVNGAAPIDTTAGPPSQSSGVYIDRNTIRRPISPTPRGKGGRTQDTSRGITAATVQGSPEQGASPPTVVPHQQDGPLAGAANNGDTQNGIPSWQWIPRDDDNYQAFLRDDTERVKRGDRARLAAHRVISQLLHEDVGNETMMKVYELLRARYEWPLTHNYQFPQLVPGYHLPPVLLRTPPDQIYRPCRGGAGTPPGDLDNNRPGRQGSDETKCAAHTQSTPWFSNLRPDPALLNRAAVLPAWGSFNGIANGGNQDFDLYASPSQDGVQSGSAQQDSQASIDQRRDLLRGREIRKSTDSQGSVSPFNLPSPIHPDPQTHGAKGFTVDDITSVPRQGVLEIPAASPRLGGRRPSVGSSWGGGDSPRNGPRGSRNGSQSTSRPKSAPINPSPSPQPANPRNAITEGVCISRSDNQPTAGQGSGSQGTQSRNSRNSQRGHRSGSRGSSGQGPSDGEWDEDDDNDGQSSNDDDPGTRTQATPMREQYQNMTVRQLHDEIRARGGNPRDYRQRKANLVQVLVDCDTAGNYGNGTQPRQRTAAIPPHPTLSPRVLRPRT